MINDLLSLVKDNLILQHTEDDDMLRSFIAAAASYAEGKQHKPPGYYADNDMTPATRQAVIMLSSHFYESRDGSTGGFFADNSYAAAGVWTAVNNLLAMDKDWEV